MVNSPNISSNPKNQSSEKTNELDSTNLSQQTPSSNEGNELDKVIAQLPGDQQEKLLEIKEYVEEFKDKIITRLEGYVMGVALLPPSKNENEELAKKGEPSEKINVLVLIDDSESTKMSKEEI